MLRSFHSIGPAQVGLVNKRVGGKLGDDQLVARKGEAGYQADLLMPGMRFKLWPIYLVERCDWVQVPPDRIGLVIAQVGSALPTGAKSAIYKQEFGNFASIRTFLEGGGQRGVQRPVAAAGNDRADPPDRLRRRHRRPGVRQDGLDVDGTGGAGGRSERPQGRAHHPAGQP